ncbi:hypothetical protein [uncultured Kocuria sp.]|nr:hypothetical protein [uncultured Kocuria sp.]
MDSTAGDSTAGDTVGKTAARWGFAHRSCFAPYYRQIYGTTPRHTFDT